MIVELGDRQIELTDEQIAAFEKLTKLQRGVALATLRGEKPADAHRIAGGTCKNEANRKDLGNQILANPLVLTFMSLMRTDPSVDIAEAVCSRDEILRDLSTIARTTIDDVAEFEDGMFFDLSGLEVINSRVRVKSIDEIPEGARKAIKSIKQTKFGLEIVLHDHVAVRKQISEMCGFNAPTKTELSGPNGGPIQTKELSDEELDEHLERLGLDRFATGQLGAKRDD